MPHLPRTVREITWKGQVRLCTRYEKRNMAGKLKTVAVTAVARELAAFLWAIPCFSPDVVALIPNTLAHFPLKILSVLLVPRSYLNYRLNRNRSGIAVFITNRRR